MTARAVAAALLGLLAAPALAAQDSGLRVLREEVARREAALQTAFRAQEAARARARAARRPPDTVVAPPVTVVVPAGSARSLGPAIVRAAERVRATWGDIAWLLADAPLRMGPEADVARTVEVLVSARVAGRAGSRLRNWALSGIPRTGPRLWMGAYVDLATAPPGAAPRCFAGDRVHCALALGLARPADPATALWDSAGRAEAVRRANLLHRRRTSDRAMRCLDAHEDAACLSLLRELQPAGARLAPASYAPVGREGREAFLATAIALGGPDAVRRLVADTTAPLADQIAAAAALPIDSVIGVWHATLLAHAPHDTVGAGTRLAMVAWILVCAGLALGGTRWRAG